MSNSSARSMFHLAIVVLALTISTFAQGSKELHLRGTISDYTPQNVSGPWEVRGVWSLTVKNGSHTADFSAALTMVRSDLGVTLSGGGDLNSPTDRNAHTHHFKVVNGTVTLLANGFEITGPITIAANGTFPPPFGPSSTVTIEVTGGNTLALSNIQVILQGDAAVHFGTQALNGVVRSVK